MIRGIPELLVYIEAILRKQMDQTQSIFTKIDVRITW